MRHLTTFNFGLTFARSVLHLKVMSFRENDFFTMPANLLAVQDNGIDSKFAKVTFRSS